MGLGWRGVGNDREARAVPAENFFRVGKINDGAEGDGAAEFGEIAGFGAQVKIRTIPDVTVSDYVIGAGLSAQYPTNNSVTLAIDQAKSFAVALSTVDSRQSDLDLADIGLAGIDELQRVAAAAAVLHVDGEAGVALAKAEIFEGLEPGGVAVLNADDRWFTQLQSSALEAGASVRSFGASALADARLIAFKPHEGGAVVEAEVNGIVPRYTSVAVLPKLDPTIRAERETLDELREKLSAKYFCNFSVFQSVPDAWAIDQVFPIVPIHRLDERPAIRGRLCDLTCDSDGRLDLYVDREGVVSTMALHELKPEQPYLLALFMVGAYQEILGDMHNLFGDTNAVNVVVKGDGWQLEGAEHGDRTDELLRYVHLAPEELAQSYRRKFAATDLPQAVRSALLAELEAGLSGYTYLS